MNARREQDPTGPGTVLCTDGTWAIRCALVRGGTSRALVFRREDLPADRTVWDTIFLAAIGSPDTRQLDGVGAGDSHTSKIAVLEPGAEPGVDVDYLFGEVAIVEPRVDYAGNSGNIIAGLGLYAVEEGLVRATDPETRVRIRNVNTGKMTLVDVPTPGGAPAGDGDFSIDGVPGTGPRIDLTFPRPGGAVTGRLLPTGERLTRLDVPALGTVEVTLLDAANPAVFVRGEALGVSPADAVGALNADRELLGRVEALRAAASAAMGLAGTAADAARYSPMIPFPVLVFEPVDYISYTGARVAAESMDLAARVISLGMVHKSINVTMSVALTVAALVPGTVPARAGRSDAAAGGLRIGHPSGVAQTRAVLSTGEASGESVVEEVRIGRTARRIMTGEVLVQPHKRRWLGELAARG